MRRGSSVVKRVKLRRTVGRGYKVSLDVGYGKIEGNIFHFSFLLRLALDLEAFSSLLGEPES